MGGFGGGHSGGGGGFHGGHSSGRSSGGFHGGHSISRSSSGYHRSGYHSSRIYHSSIHVNGSSIHTGRGKNEYNKPAVASSIIFALVVFFIGVFIFIHTYNKSTTATVTNVELISNSYEHYERYDFTYVANGKLYTGAGDDDLLYYFSDLDYEFSVKLGEQYTIYYKLLDPANYTFESDNGPAVFLLFIVTLISGAIIISTFNNLNNYKKRLSYIGDLNGDGKIDDKDVAIYLKRNFESNNEKSSEPKYKVCEYCESLVSIDEKNCPNCGASLKL